MKYHNFKDITAHQEEFIQMLNEDAGDDAPAAQEQLGGAGGPTITREQVISVRLIIV